MRKLQLAIMAAALVMAVQARASWYDITFSGTGLGNGGDNIPNNASGQIEVVNNIAISGFLNVTTGDALGDYTLTPAVSPGLLPGAGSIASQPWGITTSTVFFTYDGVVFPESTPFIDVAGLLFTSNGSTQLKLGIFWNPLDEQFQYALFGTVGGLLDHPVDSGSATITPVPEPTTIIAGALLLLPFGASTLRILRRKTRTA